MSDYSRVTIKDEAWPLLKAEATLAEQRRRMDGTGNSSRPMDDRAGGLGDVSKANGHVSWTSVGRHPMEMKYDGDRDDRGSGHMIGHIVNELSTNPNVNVNVNVAASAKHKMEMKTETSSSNSNSNSNSDSEKENTDNGQTQNKAQYTYEDEEAMTAARGGHPFWDSMSADPMA